MDLSTLTGRELEVLGLLALGEPSRLLARRLEITERTVRAHCASIVRKLGVDSKLQAAIVSHLHADDIRRAAHPASADGSGTATPRGVPRSARPTAPSYSTTC